MTEMCEPPHCCTLGPQAPSIWVPVFPLFFHAHRLGKGILFRAWGVQRQGSFSLLLVLLEKFIPRILNTYQQFILTLKSLSNKKLNLREVEIFRKISIVDCFRFCCSETYVRVGHHFVNIDCCDSSSPCVNLLQKKKRKHGVPLSLEEKLVFLTSSLFSSVLRQHHDCLFGFTYCHPRDATRGTGIEPES